MHEKFCIVSDRPEFIHVDEENRPHCETGPSHRWRDGWEIYSWHGTQVPPRWIMEKDTINPAEIIRHEDVELRSVGCEIIGWPRIVDQLDRTILDGDPDSDIGALIALKLPGLDRPGRFLQAVCPHNGTIVEGVPYESDVDGSPIDTAIAAQAWRDGLPVSEYQHPLIRT